MRSKISKMTSLLLVVSLVTISVISSISIAGGFTDLKPTHWCYEKIMEFLDKGYVSGYEDGTFRADRTITRAEYVKIVNNFFGYSVDEENINSEFSDVSEKDWFAAHVAEAVERGYITGYPDGTFRPNEPLRRQEATVILSRILGIDEEIYPKDHVDGMMQYSDGEEIEDWAYVAVHSYSVYNFINGYTDGTIKILQNVTRAETVELLNLLEEKIVIDREDDDKKPGGGGTSVKKVKTPKIEAYELIDNKEVIVDEWVNFETSFDKGQIGSLIKITCETEAATIYYQINGGTVQEYTEPFILTDGKLSGIKAWAEKKYMADSSKAELIVNVDTIPPIANGVLNETNNTVTVSVKDYDFYNIGENKLSGVSGESLRYAWFTLNKSGKDYIRESDWIKFNNNSVINAPQAPGIYYLGVKGSDIAENKIGTGSYQSTSNIDDLVDIPDVDDEKPTNEPFVILTEISKDEPIPENPTPNPGEEPSPEEEEIIVVVVKAPVYIIHDFDDLPSSGDIIQKDEAVPGAKYIAYPLSGDKYPIVDNYDNDGTKTIKSVSRVSGDKVNTVIINYTRIKIKVDYDANGGKGTTPKDFEINAGDCKLIESGNSLEKVGHYFAGWSGDNGLGYQSGDKFEAIAGNTKVGAAGDDRKVVLSAIWVPKSYKVNLISGDYIEDVAFMTGNTIESTLGERIYKYGEKVEISAILKEPRKGYENIFVTWSGDSLEDLKDDPDFNKLSRETFFVMPATNITLEAVAKESVLKTPYKIIHYLETFESGDYVEHKVIESSGDTDKKLIEGTDYKVEEYTGFEYQKKLTTPLGDKIISAEDELEIKLYYKRLSYNLELVSGDSMVTYLSGDGTYKYGQEVTIEAETESYVNGAKYGFGEWEVIEGTFEKNTSFDKSDSETTFTMPANNLKLRANSSKIDVNFSNKKINGFTDSNTKKNPEPGDVVGYTVNLKNTGDEDTEIKLDIIASSGYISNVKIDDKAYNISGDTIIIGKNETIIITFDAEIGLDFEVGEGNNFVVSLTAETLSSNLLATEEIEITPERMSAINYRTQKDKNIVLLIDLSGSMGFCTVHTSSGDYLYSGDNITKASNKSGDYIGQYDETIEYDEEADILFDYNGDVLLDYDLTTKEPWGHHKLNGVECKALIRIDVLIDALTQDGGFIDTVIAGAKENDETITITLVTFSGYKENEKTNDPLATVAAKVEIEPNISDSNLAKSKKILINAIEEFKYEIHDGTNLVTGLDKVKKVIDELPSGDNVENYFIFFGDGAATDASGDILEGIKPLLGYEENETEYPGYFEYSYAIGFGTDFDIKENSDILNSLSRTRAAEKAEDAEDIVAAFDSIASEISATGQTVNGILEISGSSFESAVNAAANYEKVFPIAVYNGSTKLFEITSESNTSPVTWLNGTTTSKFEFIKTAGKISGVKIDLSGVAFINKNDISVMLDCE